MSRSMIIDPPRDCEICGKRLERKRFGDRLECRTRFLSRKTCGQSCGNTRKEVTLAGLRGRAKKLRGDECEDCGETDRLQAHHIDGDVTNNTPLNIATLCGSCHMKRHWSDPVWRENTVRRIRESVVRSAS